MIKELLIFSVLALITMSGVIPRLINAQPQGIEPASNSIGLSLQPQSQHGNKVIAEQQSPDIVLLSSRFSEQSFSDEIVGEVMNNGTGSAEYVQALATFRDSSGAVIDTASGYADPHLIMAKDSAPFKILFTSDIVEDNAATYDITLKWRDLDFEEFSQDVLTGQPLNERDIDDNDSGSSGDSSNGNDDGGYGCEPNLECQLEENREWAKDHIGNFDDLSEEDQESMIDDVLNDVDEDYLDAQEEKQNEGEQSEDEKENSDDNSDEEDKQNEE